MNTPTEGIRQAGADMLARLPLSPDIYPQKVDFARHTVLLVEFSAASYRAASFLDDRILTPGTKGIWVPAGPIAEASRRLATARPLHFIFHMGHVGSTLFSRLLDETGAVLPLREPLPLRLLAELHDQLGKPDSLFSETQFESMLGTFARLWSRGYADTRCVVLKATSSAARLATPLLSRSADARAVYLSLSAEPFLAILLSGSASVVDLRGHGPERMRRLLSFAVDPTAPLHQLSLGELAALGWLAESLSRRDTLARFPGRVVAMDFDRVLADLPAAIAQATSLFGLPRDDRYLATIGQSPVLTRYAKAPEHAYSPQLRQQVLADSRARNSEEVKKGLAWLERVAKANPSVGSLLSSNAP